MQEPKAVFVQSYGLFPDFRLDREITEILALGAEVHAVVWQRSESDPIRNVPGVRIHKIRLAGRHGMNALQLLLILPRFFIAVFIALREIGPQLIIAHNLDAAVPSVAYRLVSRNVRLIYVSREPYHKVFRVKTGIFLAEWFGWLLDACVAHLSSVVFAVTPAMLRMYRSMGVEPIWMPNAPIREYLDVTRKQPEEGCLVVGFVGNLRRDCGIEEMYEAVKIASAKSGLYYRLLLCGMPLGDMPGYISKISSETPQLVQVLPPVPPAKLPEIYSGIDIAFQFPYPNAKYGKYGLNVKIYEAMAAGIPVIMNNVSENLGFLGDSESYLLVGTRNPVEIAHQLLLLKDKGLRSRVGEKGRAFVKERFNWDLFKGQYRSIASELLR